MIKQTCQFVLAAGLVGIALAPSDADAKYRSIDGHGCRNTTIGVNEQFDCALPTGSDFSPLTIDVLEVDGRTAAGYVGASVCRRTFAQWTVTCGVENLGYHPTQSNYSRWLDVTVLRGGNAWDYRWVHVTQPASDYSDVGGVYLNNSDL